MKNFKAVDQPIAALLKDLKQRGLLDSTIVVLLDMRMPNLSGLDVLKTLTARGQLPPTIILTTFDDDQIVLAGLKAGARGYLLKDVTLDQLVDAVKTVAAGGSLVKPAVTQRLLAGLEHMHNQFASLDQSMPWCWSHAAR